ncbi:unnamed protein product [Brachionus calyciflorus]|uniref:SAP domain-containing protein n=1 Tax=Brachionus calyciflorus TaxID=104777 RepID=A0A813M271_9BILA|nr:unnamed protein product [Brachionus calyciflorus]
MSHYNSTSSGGSWQSQRNSLPTNQTQPQHETNSTSNLTGLFNSSAAANLLAQFSSLGNVNISNLAANLPALVAASNTTNNINSLPQAPPPSNQTQSTSSGYQWHSQNRLATQNNQQTTTNQSNTSQSYLLGPGGTMSSYNTSKPQNSTPKQNNYDPRNDSKNKNTSTYSKMPSYSTNSGRDNRPPQQNRYQNNQQNNNNNNSNSNNNSYNSNNKVDKFEPSQPVIQNNPILPNINPNPLLAQALLTQLAQTTQQNQNNLVAALAAAVTSTNLGNNLNSTNSNMTNSNVNMNTTNSNNYGQKVNRRSRSRSRSRSRNWTRSRSRSRESSIRARSNRPLNKTESTRDIRRVVQRSSRSKSPISLSKRLSYPSTRPKELSKDTKDTFKDKDLVKEKEIEKPKEKEVEKPKEIPLKESKEIKTNRYSIKLPKFPLDTLSNNVSTVKLRYPNLYIPSDYIYNKNSWLNSLSLNRPLKFNSKCQFHIMSKDALPIQKNTSVYDATDVDYRWQVKVMLLAMPNQDDFYKRCCSFAEDNLKENRFDHPSKVIQFLVGNKGKHELMALGGPWSPSLDGSNPAGNVQTLINTAIRNVKALTGIDLSPCTQWFRFLDIQYNRNEEFKTTVIKTNCTTSNHDIKADDKQQEKQDEEALLLDDDKYVENTVIFLPNVWSLMPTNIEYQKQVESYLKLVENEPEWVNEPVQQINAKEEVKTQNGDLSTSLNQDDQAKNLKVEADVANSCDVNEDSNANTSLANEEDREPTHYSKLDLKKMKVDELRSELAARNLDTKGLKPQLINRLKEAIEAEKAHDGIDLSIDPKEASFLDDPIDSSQQSLILEEDLCQNKAEQKSDKKTQAYNWSKLSKNEREKVYRLPSTPHIIVHPSPTFKQNKFECQLVSLSHILDYRREDNKECSFEVFLFAECFHEMLLRDNGFQIFKHILGLKDDTDKSNSNGKRKLPDEENSNDSKKTKTEENDSAVKSSNRPKTLYPDLLLSFTYFDTNRTNYLNEKDLEDLFFLLGLNLSRSKSKALMKKLTIRDGLFNYRTLTDRSIVSNSSNNFYKFPTDDDIVNSIISFDSYVKRFGVRVNNEKSESQAYLIELNGSTVDVLSTLKKLEKCEENLKKLDLSYKDSLDELDRLKTQNKSLDRHKQKLTDEASELRKKLRDEQKFSKDSDDKYLKLKDCLYRTKSQLNKVLDDISDTTRRSQKSNETGLKTTKSDLDMSKKESNENKEVKKSENTQQNSVETKKDDEIKEDVQNETQKESEHTEQVEQSEHTEEANNVNNENSNENDYDLNDELLEIGEKTDYRIDEF